MAKFASPELNTTTNARRRRVPSNNLPGTPGQLNSLANGLGIKAPSNNLAARPPSNNLPGSPAQLKTLANDLGISGGKRVSPGRYRTADGNVYNASYSADQRGSSMRSGNHSMASIPLSSPNPRPAMPTASTRMPSPAPQAGGGLPPGAQPMPRPLHPELFDAQGNFLPQPMNDRGNPLPSDMNPLAGGQMQQQASMMQAMPNQGLGPKELGQPDFAQQGAPSGRAGIPSFVSPDMYGPWLNWMQGQQQQGRQQGPPAPAWSQGVQQMQQQQGTPLNPNMRRRM